jgi:hypothetical protein
MAATRRYEGAMKRGAWALVAVFSLLLAPAALAQVNGVPASVSSIGFGGNFSRPPGVPASVTSIGPAGLVPNRNVVVPHNFITQPYYYPGGHNGPSGHNGPRGQRHDGGRRHGFRGAGVALYPVPYAVPIAVPYAEEDSQAAPEDYQDQQEYQGGPTIFDRRGPGQPVPQPYPAQAEPTASAAQPASEPSEPVADQPQTVLVFKDDHQLEVQNYAIVGDTLYDMTPGHRRRVALSELNVTATRQQNEDRGLSFDVPTAN